MEVIEKDKISEEKAIVITKSNKPTKRLQHQKDGSSIKKEALNELQRSQSDLERPSELQEPQFDEDNDLRKVIELSK